MMTRQEKILGLILVGLLIAVGILMIRSYWEARAQQVYRVLDTTREQFLGQEPGALGSRSVLTFTAVSRRDDGEVHLLPLGIVGDWEILPAPLLPHSVEAAAAVVYKEPDPPYRRRIYLIGGFAGDPEPAQRLDTVYTCEIYPDGSLSDWTLQSNRLPQPLSSPAAAISTQDVYGNPITPTLYVLGGKYFGGTSDEILYSYIDPATLNVGPWRTAGSTLGGSRLALSAVANDGYLYAIGGFDGISSYVGSVWHFSLDTNGEPFGRSTDVSLPGDFSDNPSGAYHQTLLVPSASPSFLTDTLYVIGGYNSTGSTPLVYRGDIYASGAQQGYIKAWVDLSEDDLPAPLAAFGLAMADVQGAGRQVYIVGGQQGTGGSPIPQNTIRSAVVNDSDNSFYDWYGAAWLTSPALPAARYLHATVQSGEFIYAIAGHGPGTSDYYRNVLRGHLVGTGARQYAPNGVFLSRVVDLDRKYRLTWLEWSNTITPTDPGVTLTLQFRAGNQPNLSDAGDAWTDWLPAARGEQTSTLYPVPNLPNFPFYPPIARYVQYRARFSTTAAYSDVTPLLHEVGMHVEDSPDLGVSNIRISCDGCYGYLGIISRTIEIQITVRNQGGHVPYGNNFYTALFITTTGDYAPQPPDWPTDPDLFLPGSTYWGMQSTDFFAGGSKVLTTTIFYTEPMVIYLYAYADYNDTGAPPDYDVGEADPDNNLTVFNAVIIDPNSAAQTQTAWYWATQTALPSPEVSHVYLPVVYKEFYWRYIYLPIVVKAFSGSPLPTVMAVALPTPVSAPPPVNLPDYPRPGVGVPLQDGDRSTPPPGP